MTVNVFGVLKLLPCPFFFQPDDETLELGRGSMLVNLSNSGVAADPCSSCCCAEHLSRISDLEGRLSLLKRQATAAVDHAGKYFGLKKRVSSLESQVYELMAKIAHLEECDSFLAGIIESTCEQLQCKFLAAPGAFGCVFSI
jgi:hypothetical protein